MITILVALALLTQAPTVLTSDNGAITGVLKTTSGTPAVGVRVTAMAVPASLQEAATSFSMISLSETDIDGRYHLENIPPGRYYITAGSVDNPTYFPGTANLAGGTIVSVTAKAKLSGIDFVMQDSTFRVDSILNARPVLSVPVQVVVENGARQPVSAYGQFVTLGMTRTADGIRSDVRLDSSYVSAQIPSPVAGAEYRITIDGLPDGYVLKSMTYGSTDLMTNPLKVDSTNFRPLTTGNPTVANGLSFSFVTAGGVTIASVGGATYTGTVRLGATTNAATPNLPTPAGVPTMFSGALSTLTVTLATVPPSTPPAPGLRITGKMPFQGGGWSVYRGDVPGIFYGDGSFELRGVPPGRHIVVLQGIGATPQYYASLVTVGERDLDGVTLENAGVLPTNLIALPSTGPGTGAGSQSSFRSLAGLVGHAVEEDGVKPVSKGIVTILGQTMSTISIGSDGQFIIPHMLPGSYDLRIEAFEHFTLYETVVIIDEDVQKIFVVRSAKADPIPETPGEQ